MAQHRGLQVVMYHTVGEGVEEGIEEGVPLGNSTHRPEFTRGNRCRNPTLL